MLLIIQEQNEKIGLTGVVLSLRAKQCMGDSALQNTVFTCLASRYCLRFNIARDAELRDMGEGKRTAAESRTALESIKLLKWAFPMKFKIFPSVSLHLTSSGELRRTPANDLFRPQQPGTKTYFPELGFVTAVFPR